MIYTIKTYPTHRIVPGITREISRACINTNLVARRTISMIVTIETYPTNRVIPRITRENPQRICITGLGRTYIGSIAN